VAQRAGLAAGRRSANNDVTLSHATRPELEGWTGAAIFERGATMSSTATAHLPFASTDKLRDLANAFRPGYPATPPLKHAAVIGAACGFAAYTPENWELLLKGIGEPWGREWSFPQLHRLQRRL
jgi:hypothetical protein